MDSSRSCTTWPIRPATSGRPPSRPAVPCSDRPDANSRCTTVSCRLAAMRSRSARMLISRSRSCIRAACWRDRRIRARRPCPATAIMAASAAQEIIRRISTAGLAMSGISETASTTARAAALTTTDSHGRWKSAVQMIGLSRMIRIPEYVPPAAWASGSTDAVYSSGTATSHQAGSRSQGTSTTSAAVTSRISALAIASGTEAGPGGSARLASARMASAANGAIRASRPSRRSAGPEVSVSGSAGSAVPASGDARPERSAAGPSALQRASGASASGSG